MKLTTSLLEANLKLIAKLREEKIDSSPLEKILVQILLDNKIAVSKIKKYKSIYASILLKLELEEKKIFKIEDGETLESKFSDFFYIDDRFLDDEEFSLDEARRELKLILKESKRGKLKEDRFDYIKGLELLRRNLNLALTSRSSYIRGLANAIVEHEKHSSLF